MTKKSDVQGADGYRRGALERIEEARRLLRAEFFAGSVYLALNTENATRHGTTQ
jgi:hypothetical protein